MYCPHCGAELVPDARFCRACGKTTSASTETVPKIAETAPIPLIEMPVPSFRRTRIMNWLFAFLLGAGSLGMLFKAPTPVGLLAIVLIDGFFVAFPIVSAIALGQQDFAMFGIYVQIDSIRRRKLQEVSYVMNLIIGGIGLIGVVACVATQQYGAMASMLIFVLPPYLNIRALRELKKFRA